MKDASISGETRSLKRGGAAAMGRLMGMITRVAMWGAFGTALGFAGVVIYQVGFTGGALKHSFSSATAQGAAVIGLIVGGIVGFVRRN